MERPISFGHSFNAGDSLTLLPAIKRQYLNTGRKIDFYQRIGFPGISYEGAEHPVKNDDGSPASVNRYMFDMMKPLMEYQEYINFYLEWKGETVDFNIDLTRQDVKMPLPGGDIHFWPTLIFPQLEFDTEPSWLDAPYLDIDEHIVVNITERYNNPWVTYFFLKEYQKRIIFAGTKHERDVFCEKWELDIPLLEVKNFLELAGAIMGAHFFLGSQSMCWHIADGLKVPRLLQVCTGYPNTFPTGYGGHCFINQGSLEYFFKKLIG